MPPSLRLALPRIRTRSTILHTCPKRIRTTHRAFSTTSFRPSSTSTTTAAPKIPYVETCPPSTCTCTPDPALRDLDIDRASPLLHTAPRYAQHIVLCTGQDDWTSRVEDEQGDHGAGDFLRGLKGVIGRGGEAFDPFWNVLTSLCSLPASSPSPSSSAQGAQAQNKTDTETQKTTTTALLFPTFTRHTLPSHNPQQISAFATAYLKSPSLHPSHATLPASQQRLLTRDPSLASLLPAPEPITNPVILICGHASRDSRCGLLGPPLRAAFTAACEKFGVEAEVALVSHIGGHKWAGNVVLYVPSGWRAAGAGAKGITEKTAEREKNEGKGRGVWYGRVGLEHVEGIVKETLVEGRVIGELLRGGVLESGEDLAREVEKQSKGEEEGTLRLKPRLRR